MVDTTAVLGSAVLAAAITSLVQWLATRRKASVEATATDVATSAALFEEVIRLRSRILDAEHRASKCDEENQQMRSRIERMEIALPLAIAAKRLKDLSGLGDLLNLLRDPIVVTTIAAGGTIIWVNDAFCEVLARTREEIIRIGWRGLIHPDDLSTTEATETMNWDRPTWGFVNRYMRADGRAVWFRWFCPPYSDDDGATISLARPVPVPVSDGNEPRLLIRQEIQR